MSKEREGIETLTVKASSSLIGNSAGTTRVIEISDGEEIGNEDLLEDNIKVIQEFSRQWYPTCHLEALAQVYT